MSDVLLVEELVLPYAIQNPIRLKFSEPTGIIGLIGQNGAGKTTLLRGIAGLLPAVSGDVRVLGTSILKLPRREIAKKIAYVQQQTEIPGELLVEEAVSYGRFAHRPFGFQRQTSEAIAADERAISAAIQTMELDSLCGRALQTLSGGERQRVAVARGLAQETPILLLDEPCAHLDLGHAISFLTRLAQAKNRLVLVALHDLNLAALFCNQLILLNFGRLIAQGTPEQILTPEILKPIYGDSLAFLTHPTAGAPQVLPQRFSVRN